MSEKMKPDSKEIQNAAEGRHVEIKATRNSRGGSSFELFLEPENTTEMGRAYTGQFDADGNSKFVEKPVYAFAGRAVEEIPEGVPEKKYKSR